MDWNCLVRSAWVCRTVGSSGGIFSVVMGSRVENTDVIAFLSCGDGVGLAELGAGYS